MTYLQRYAKYITVGLRNESAEEHTDWRQQHLHDIPEDTEAFKRLEHPKSWNELFEAMSELSWTQSDVISHCQELQSKGHHTLANAVRLAADSEPGFKYMESG